MRKLNDLVLALDSRSSLEKLFSLCKELRGSGIESKTILAVIDDFIDKNDPPREYEEVTDEIISALVGYCHPDCSLA